MEYNKLNLDELREIYAREIEKKKPTDERFVVIKEEATTKVRILPSNKPGRQFFIKSGVHKVGEDWIDCPKHTKGLRCPVCEEVARLYKSTNPADIELARSLKAKKKFYFVAIVRGEEDKGPRILNVGVKLYEKILNTILNPEVGDITDPESGFDFNITKKMKAGYWNYDESEAARRQSKLSENKEEAAKWINEQPDAEILINIQEYDVIKSKLINFIAPGNMAHAMNVAESVVAAKESAPVIQPPQPPKAPAAVEKDEDITDFANKIAKLREDLAK